jgi:uncharacterized protein YdeI (YjbR/CyaY-like superfamily)
MKVRMNMRVKEFATKKEAKNYIDSLSKKDRDNLRPQIRKHFTWLPTPHERFVLIAFNSHTLCEDGTFQKTNG